MLKEHLGHTLKAKNSIASFLDKMRSAAKGDSSCAGMLALKPSMHAMRDLIVVDASTRLRRSACFLSSPEANPKVGRASQGV